MANYKSERVSLKYSAEDVFGKLSHPEKLKDILNNVPDDQIDPDKLQALQQIQCTSDSIAFPAGPVGMLTMRVTEKEEPRLIRLEGEGSPVPISLTLHIFPDTDSTCEAEVDIDIEIPAMLKPMVSGPLKKMTAQFAEMLRMIPFSR